MQCDLVVVTAVPVNRPLKAEFTEWCHELDCFIL
jgi:hypothetical protein